MITALPVVTKLPPEVDDLIRAYLASNPLFTNSGAAISLTELVDAEKAARMCDDVAADFTAFAIDYARLHNLSVDADIWQHQNPQLFFSNPVSGLLHTVSRIYYRDERIFVVDWTSSQYGNNEFPALRLI